MKDYITPASGNVTGIEAHREKCDREVVDRLSQAISSWYVRKDSKYFAVDRLHVKLALEDIQRASLHRFPDAFPNLEITNDHVREAFRIAVQSKMADRKRSIPIWNGSMACSPKHADRFIWENGTVTVNTWAEPEYRKLRDVRQGYGVIYPFLAAIFEREEEKLRFLDWLTWCLKNEGDKPAWAPFLFSANKGTGKSTLCKLVARLFGEENSIFENNVDKLTSKFNSPVLMSKLVVSEEVNLRADSKQGNALKTFITETAGVAERKGVEAEKVNQVCCFLFTSNHLPLWIEQHDRRYYLIEMDHDGHASGPKAEEFGKLVAEVHKFMENDRNVAALYQALISRPAAPEFNAKALNVLKDATPLMIRVHGAAEDVRKAQLRERLQDVGIHAITERALSEFVGKELNGNISQTKHLMTDLGWSRVFRKWDGRGHSRAIWVDRGYAAQNGRLSGPEAFGEDLAKHLKRGDQLNATPFDN